MLTIMSFLKETHSMSKSKLLATLVLGLGISAAAVAQSNVTIYGTADAGMVYSTSDRTDNVDKKTGIQGGLLQRNKLGFRGSENLGNGLKANFQIEMGYDLGQNTGLDNSRESFVGLSGNFGAVRLGRLETLDSVAAAQFDALSASAFSPLAAVVGRETFDNSAASYQTNVGNFALGVQYAFDGSSANANTAFGSGVDQERSVNLSAGYNRGPFETVYVFTNTSNYNRVANDDRKMHVLGASYDFQTAKVYGTYLTTKSDIKNTIDLDVYALGVKVPVTKTTVVDASVARANDDAVNGHANIYGIQAVHSLSKRTAAYAGYQYVKNSGTQYAALNTNGIALQGINKTNSSGFGVGLRHNF
jgi:predicted porin